MDSDSQLTNNNGGWANWARSHHLLVSALAHIGLFAVAWLLARYRPALRVACRAAQLDTTQGKRSA